MFQKAHILIVDDVAEYIDIATAILEDTYEVHAATSASIALKILKNGFKPDLILLDILMPDTDGYELCALLKKDNATKDIPIIFITAMSNEESTEKAYSVGGADYVTKPLKPFELLARVKVHLESQSFIHSLEVKVEAQVDEISQTKELMVQTTRMAQIGEMMSMLAHQWMQPLSVISSISNRCLMDLELNKFELKGDCKYDTFSLK